MRHYAVLSAIACILVTAPVAQGQGSDQYMVQFSRAVPDDLGARLSVLGGSVVETFPEIQAALVRDLTPAAATQLRAQKDVADVTQDEPLVLPSPSGIGRATLSMVPAKSSAISPQAAYFYSMQWDKMVIGADKAWKAGYLGSADVRIAIIDTGIDPTQADVANLVDWGHSQSFCPSEDPFVEQQFPGYPAWTDLHGHGTWVASIASSEAHYVAGITSKSKLMALKAGGIVPCSISGVVRALAYAARQRADVINISLGSVLPISKSVQKRWTAYFNSWFQYALSHGVSAIVVSAGNSSIDLDHDGNGYAIFCDVPGVICVSATGPTDSGIDFLGPFVNPDTPAYYTNYGSSAIHVAAPGGNASFDAAGNISGLSLVWGACATTDREFDANGNLVLGICSAGAYWALGGLGTSAAAPQVSGLAALLVSVIGRGNPGRIRAAIENSAVDLGKPGVDPYYGKGRLSVSRALGLE